MKLFSLPVLSAIAIALGTAFSARAAVIYSGLQDLVIPTNFVGLYLDIETGVTSSGGNWDINPFFGGVGIANSPTFQPARSGLGRGDAIVKLGAGAQVGAGLSFASGHGGSQTHLGSGAGQFAIGGEGYLAFRFITNGGLSTHYGWMRVVLTANTEGAVIRDWAYEDGAGYDPGVAPISSPMPLSVGRVQQSPASGGVRLTTLSPGFGESFILGSPVVHPGGGNVGSLLKVGAGATLLAAPQTFTGATTINGGTLEIASGGRLSATASVLVNTGGTLLFSGAGGGDAKVNLAAALSLGGGKVAATGVTSSLDQRFGTLTLAENSTIDFGTLAVGNTFRFADSSGAAWASGTVLNIWNWTAGADRLYVGSSASGITASQLGQIRFYSDSGTTLLGPGIDASLGEILVNPVPEPSSLAVALGLVGLIGLRENWLARRNRHRGR